MLRRIYNRSLPIRYTLFCPICKTYVRCFLPGGTSFLKHLNAICPACGSYERHRLTFLYWQHKTDIFDGSPKKMLHFAAENCFVDKLKNISYITYLTADLSSSSNVNTDITKISFQNNVFDVIYCSHVLEHVRDDHSAIQELFRILKPGGWAILQVPITGKKTFEDPAVQDPDERERLFGQCDHVRAYGKDFKQRLEIAGFNVKIDRYVQNFNEQEIRHFGLQRNEDIYFCQKYQQADYKKLK
ncbi:MAG: methyltransferase domain-containing protein [Desulfobacterales bacterium]|nr:methyltransferase domain-containing protein [Desulfobacterales bacterium]